MIADTPPVRLYISVELPPHLRTAPGRAEISIEGVIDAAAGGGAPLAAALRRHLRAMAGDVSDIVAGELLRAAGEPR